MSELVDSLEWGGSVPPYTGGHKGATDEKGENWRDDSLAGFGKMIVLLG